MKTHLSHSKDELPEDHKLHEEQNMTSTSSIVQNDERFINNQVLNDSFPLLELPILTTTISMSNKELESVNEVMPAMSSQDKNDEDQPARFIKNLKRNLRSEMQTSETRHSNYALLLIILCTSVL